MKRNDELLKKIKRASWNNKVKWEAENVGKKMLSTYAVNESLEKPKDWDAIAKKCSENPNHQHFGKSVEDIRLLWSKKADKGAAGGNSLDVYMTVKLTGSQIDISDWDETLQKKCSHFDKLQENFISKLDSYIGSEIWLNSYVLGLCVRLDSLFTIKDNSQLLIGELKSTENISTEDRWNYLVGPAKHLQQTDYNKYSIQNYIYAFILEELGFTDVRFLIFNITTENYFIKKPAFEYDKQFIIDCAKWCHDIKYPVISNIV